MSDENSRWISADEAMKWMRENPTSAIAALLGVLTIQLPEPSPLDSAIRTTLVGYGPK